MTHHTMSGCSTTELRLAAMVIVKFYTGYIFTFTNSILINSCIKAILLLQICYAL